MSNSSNLNKRHSFKNMKSGDSLSTKDLSENLFRRLPSIFHVIEVNTEEGRKATDIAGVVSILVSDFKASTMFVDLSELESLNSHCSQEFQELVHLQL